MIYKLIGKVSIPRNVDSNIFFVLEQQERYPNRYLDDLKIRRLCVGRLKSDYLHRRFGLVIYSLR